MSHRISDIYQSEWLKAEDLQGRAVSVVISRATVETMRRPDGSRPDVVVLAFVAKQRRLALNATQARAIAVQLGDEIDEWPGHTIRIAPGTAPNGKLTIVVLKPEELVG